MSTSPSRIWWSVPLLSLIEQGPVDVSARGRRALARQYGVHPGDVLRQVQDVCARGLGWLSPDERLLFAAVTYYPETIQ